MRTRSEVLRDRIRSVVRRFKRPDMSARFDTSDVVQEVELQFWQQGITGNGGSAEVNPALLSTIAKGHLAKYQRKHSAKKRSVNQETPANGCHESLGLDPQESMEFKELSQRLLDAMRCLEPIDQTILHRRFLKRSNSRTLPKNLICLRTSCAGATAALSPKSNVSSKRQSIRMSSYDPKETGELSHQDFELYEELLGTVAAGMRREFEHERLFDDQSLFGRYKIQSVLGYGGQAYCFRAFDDQLERDIVIKLYREGLSRDRKYAILREGRALAKIKSPNVAQCYTVDEVDGRPFLVLEYISGQTLARWALSQDISSERALEIAEQITNALIAAHEKGLLHLDLKPNNIVMDADETIKLVDFGLTRNIEESDDSSVAGSPAFLAPERLVAPDEINEQIDIYGLGCVVFFLLTRSAPVPGDSKEEILENVSSGKINLDMLVEKGASKRAVQFCQRCIQFMPEDRFQSAHEARTFLRAHRVAAARRRRFATSALLVVLLGALSYLWFANPFATPDDTSPADRIREAVKEENFDAAIAEEDSAFADESIESRVASTQRKAVHAERKGDFELARSFHQTVLDFLDEAPHKNEFDIIIRRELIRSCERISRMGKQEQEGIARALVKLQRAKTVGVAKPHDALNDYRSGINDLIRLLGKQDLRTALWSLKYLDLQDGYGHSYWQTTNPDYGFKDRLEDTRAAFHKHLGQNHPKSLRVNWVHANHLMHRSKPGDRDKGQGMFRTYYQQLTSLMGDRISRDVADACTAMAIIELQTGGGTGTNLMKCVEFIDRSIAIRKQLVGENSIQVSESYHFKTSILLSHGQFDLAIQTCQEAVALMRKLIQQHDGDDLEASPQSKLQLGLAEALIRLGDCYKLSHERVDQDNHALLTTALGHYQESRKLLSDRHSESLQYATVSRQIAKILLAQRDLEKAKREIQHALESYRASHGKGGPHLPTFLEVLANVHAAAEEYDEAIDIVENLLADAEQRQFEKSRTHYEELLEELRRQRDSSESQ